MPAPGWRCFSNNPFEVIKFMEQKLKGTGWYKIELRVLFLAFGCLLLVGGCSDDESIDTTYPVISVDFTEAFPKQCSGINKGEMFTFKARFTDNAGLGSFSLDVHHNFDHHTHSTEVNDCDMDPVKVFVKPFLMIKNYSIPDGLREYEADVDIEVPGDVDSGDYHLMILLTDKAGWQSIKGLSIKIN